MAGDDNLQSLITQSWRIDRASSGTPAYAQIEERLVDLIGSGRLSIGDRLPAERDLAEWVGVSRMTARAALRSLAQRGLVERGVGRGTFVARAKVDRDLTQFAGFTEMVRGQGLAPNARIRALNEVAAPETVAAALDLPPGAAVYRLERVRFADDEPLTLEDSWVPAERFPGLLDHDVRGSMYALMADEYDRAPVRAVERLEPVIASEHHAHALGVDPGAPLMLVERVAFDSEDVPVEFARDRHRGDRARFVVSVATGVAAGR
jgi:GntR family transcriptional regulator